MYSTITSRHVFIGVIVLFISSTVILRYDLHRLPFNIFQTDFHVHCFEWRSDSHRLLTMYNCPHYSQMNSLIWTYDNSGLMKYIQWMVIRKLANIRITRLNDDCYIIQERFFASNSAIDTFIQVYILSLSANLTEQSKCSVKISQIANINIEHLNQIYFKRKSLKATAFFHQLNSNSNFTPILNISLVERIEKAHNFTFKKWININSEDLIKSNLTDCEKSLTNLLFLLGLKTLSKEMKNIIEYDSHRFIEDATWWDQSEVAERVFTQSIPLRPLNLTYSNDFYYLHGSQSFIEYLSQNRRCYNEGIFPQLQSENITNRSSTDQPDRCAWKSFDCAFSDIYSFVDREQMYQSIDDQHDFNEHPLKCGFAVPSIFDKVRKQYARNYTCQTIVFTSITNCYDPLPEIQGVILPSFCFVALLDTKTIDSYKKFYKIMPTIPWDLIDLGVNATPFSVAAKSAETVKIVGQRMFPLAKWIIWLDGKGRINDISQLLAQTQVPVLGAVHPDGTRTSAFEVIPTIARIGLREYPGSPRLTHSVLDIKSQEEEYKHDGFYSRSNALKLKMFDIAVFLYRNNHPCIYRYLCGWHNEVSYYSYRGQLSVYYSAVRLNLTNYLQYLPYKFYSTGPHRAVC